MQVYLAGPITHLPEFSEGWADDVAHDLKYEYGVECVVPRAQSLYESVYDITKFHSGQVLTLRDHIGVVNSDVVLANFENSYERSLGTAIELGWASEAGIPIVGVIPEGNVHEHPMILALLAFRVYTLDEGVRVVAALSGDKWYD